MCLKCPNTFGGLLCDKWPPMEFWLDTCIPSIHWVWPTDLCLNTEKYIFRCACAFRGNICSYIKQVSAAAVYGRHEFMSASASVMDLLSVAGGVSEGLTGHRGLFTSFRSWKITGYIEETGSSWMQTAKVWHQVCRSNNVEKVQGIPV